MRGEVSDLRRMTEPLVFRSNVVLRTGAQVAMAVLVVVAGILLALSGPWPDRIVSAGCLLGGAGLAYSLSVRPRLEIDDREVLVVAPIGSKRFPRSEFQSASGGRFLTLHRRAGEDIKVFAVQNANLSLMLKREGRTERVAQQLNDLVRSDGRS